MHHTTVHRSWEGIQNGFCGVFASWTASLPPLTLTGVSSCPDTNPTNNAPTASTAKKRERRIAIAFIRRPAIERDAGMETADLLADLSRIW